METGARIDHSASRAQPPARTWLDDEPTIGRGLTGTVARLARRGRATWPLWVPLAIGFGLAFTWFKGRRFSVEATVVLRVTEGTVADAGASLGSAALRSYVQDRAFTRRNLLELMARHPREFALAKVEPTGAITNLLKVVDIDITDNDFVEDRGPGDSARSARIEVTYHAGKPELAFAVARELAELIVESASSSRQAVLDRAQSAADLVLRRAEATLTATADDAAGEGPATADAAAARLRAAVASATEAGLARRAGEERQALHFDVIDEGRIPRPRSRAAAVTDFVVGVFIGLLAGCLLAGAFDPRVLDRQDVAALGLRVVGDFPALPRPGASPPQAPPDP